MSIYPDKITNEEELEELISRPRPEAIEMFSHVDGDIMFLGVSGKIGPSLARMAKRACDRAGVKKRIAGVARFDSGPNCNKRLKAMGIETIKGDLLDPGFLNSLLN